MIQRVKNVLKRREAKLFTFFFILSGLAWFISNLSYRYESNAFFDLEFVNPPDSMMMQNASEQQIQVRLEAEGFQFLGWGFGKKKVAIDLSQANRIGTRYMLTPDVLESQIAEQLAGDIKLIRTGSDTLFVDFYSVASKKLPVRHQLRLEFEQNYLLDGKIELRPDSIRIKGPMNEIDTINFLKTAPITLVEINNDFTINSKVIISPLLKKTSLAKSEVRISGTISRFSEKLIRVPVTMINIPENTIAQTFPNEVELLVKASLTELKKIKTSQFKIVGDYATVQAGSQSVLLKVIAQPSTIHSAELKPDRVDFILKRE